MYFRMSFFQFSDINSDVKQIRIQNNDVIQIDIRNGDVIQIGMQNMTFDECIDIDLHKIVTLDMYSRAHTKVTSLYLSVCSLPADFVS